MQERVIQVSDIGTSRARELIVQPHGGVGNQLFMYAAALHTARRLNFNLCLDFPRNHKSFTNQMGCISDFKLNARVQEGTHLFEPNWINNRLSRLLGCESFPSFVRHGIGSRITHFRSHEVGFSSSLQFAKSPSFISGYFQTWKYWEELSVVDQDILGTSYLGHSKFEEIKSQISSSNSMIVHIRRGDYLNFKNSIGILDSDFFRRGIEHLKNKNGDAQIFVFTDSPSSVEIEMGGLSRDLWTIVDPEGELTPTETLRLMSFGKSFVISNSTFSWWAAMLSKSDPSKIVIPEKWFKNRHDPRSISPTGWVKIPSSWK